ncbi:MAG: PhoPQ-activated protein PqaA family protein, partial [Armatimonadota bacterium]|nr:PhoPQ-activated protein PqaA family protein [Armatimonadota bacterium]
FAAACARREPLPKVEWTYRETAKGLELTIVPAGRPAAVSFWTAASETKDFRKAKWTEQKGQAAENRYTSVLEKPQTGYAAVFGEVVYGEGDNRYWLSTTPRMTR